VTHAIQLELFFLTGALLGAGGAPSGGRDLSHGEIEGACTIDESNTCLIESHATAIAQEIAIPVFATTDAPVAGFDGVNEAFHVVIGPRLVRQVVTADQVGTPSVGDLQEVRETALLGGSKGHIEQLFSERGTPLIEALRHSGIGHGQRLRP